jgi:shikimate dehydrogenase
VNAEGSPGIHRRLPDAHESRVETAMRVALGDLAALRPATNHVAAALVGRGIEASRTPGMHEAEGARLGLRYGYRLIDFDRFGLADSDLEAVVSRARVLGLRGLNVTHPFKESVVQCLDALSPDAAAVGAVNTVVFTDGRSTGHNTDSYGFAESFRRSLPGAPLGRVLLLGAGGGGMAVAHALLDLGVASLRIVDRIPGKAQILAARLAQRVSGRSVDAGGEVAEAVATADGIVNATPSGMSKYPGSPIDETLLHPGLWVADIVYFPAETALIRAARAAGCRTLAGGGMAVFQAVEAFRLITGVRADPGEMTRHFASVSAV